MYQYSKYMMILSRISPTFQDNLPFKPVISYEFIITDDKYCEDKKVNCDLYTGRGNLISSELITEYTKETFEILIGVYGFDPSEFEMHMNMSKYNLS